MPPPNIRSSYEHIVFHRSRENMVSASRMFLRYVILILVACVFIGPFLWLLSTAMKVFEEVFIMTNGGPLSQTETLVFFVYQNAFIEFDMGYASAAGIALFAITFLFSIFNLMLLRDTTPAR